MGIITWRWLFWLIQAGLQKALALADKGSSPKRKRDSSSESEGWKPFSLNLRAKKLLPATGAKRATAKANEATKLELHVWEIEIQKNKANAARNLFRAYPATAWPSDYWVQIPLKNLLTNQMDMRRHSFGHVWLASCMADRKAVLESQPAKAAEISRAMSHICLSLFGLERWPEKGLFPTGFHGDGAPVQGTMREESLGFLAMANCIMVSTIPFTVLQAKFHFWIPYQKTFSDILLWSLGHLKKGAVPKARHDGSPSLISDKHKKKVGPVACQRHFGKNWRGLDWLSSWLNFPTYNTKSGMRWRRQATWPESKAWTVAERSSGMQRPILFNESWTWANPLPFVGVAWNGAVCCVRPTGCTQWVGAGIAGQSLVDLSACFAGRSFKARVPGIL